jgi:hypothetical protein
VLALIEDRPGTFHYLVIVAWSERGIVFHDPARAPFRVMSAAEFDSRWRVSDRWMAVVVPEEGRLEASATDAVLEAGSRLDASTPCDTLIADGVRHAQANDLAAAERVLTTALTCPGPAAPRELAGVRLLQKRWPEVVHLASAAVALDAQDAHSWKLLATGRFLQDDRAGALSAWNEVGEPRVDLVRVDGLRRTRQRVVERLIDVRAGRVLTPSTLLRARRRLAELPSAASTRLDYVPVPSGLAELRTAVAERPLYPSGRLPLAALALSTAATRELRVGAASLTGGGEQLAVAWRFWERRPRLAAELTAPAPWGGVWGIEAFAERQPFTAREVPPSERTSAFLRTANWASDVLRLDVGTGIDRWRGRGPYGRLAAETRVLSRSDRIDIRLRGNMWLGDTSFGQARASAVLRTSTDVRGLVGLAMAAAEVVGDDTPAAMWPAADTGHARRSLSRAHPVLADGRLRVERLGRALTNLSLEVQNWWRPAGIVRAAVAAFGDFSRTSRRLNGTALDVADVGVGARIGLVGVPGIFRVDVARGLTDGAAAVSFVYQP